MSTDKEKNKNIIRDFGASTWALNNRSTVFFLTFIMLVAGLYSYNTLPKESFPEVSLPTIYVGTVYPGNSPADIENLITRPIEKELNSITGVSKIQSSSVQDFSSIIVEFESDIDVTEALQDVKDAVDKSKKELPTDLDTDPNVFELNFSEFPIMNINLSGQYSFKQLKDYAEELEDRIEKLQEISKVEIRGLQEEEVQINVDLLKLQAVQLSFRDIENAIRQENVTISGGNILTEGFRRSIRVVGEFTDVREMDDIIIKDENQETVYLKDVAEIKFAFKEAESYARLNREPVVMLDVVKRSGENLINASDKINAIVADAKLNLLPKDLNVTITLDQTINTRTMVADLENNIISGIILVVLVLLFFLGTRNSLFVGIAIPLSMFMSFMIIGALGISINMMVLFGLIMALGMLVDNGIVVVENIYRLMDEGYSPYQAAKEGIGEVAWPIISSTATTLAAFMPLVLWPGIMGQFMKYLPITLIIVLGSSLFVALVINPVFTAIFMKVGADDKINIKKTYIYAGVSFVLGIILLLVFKSIWGSNLLFFFGALLLLNMWVLTPLADKFMMGFLPKLENFYEKVLQNALKGYNPLWYFLGTFALLFFSLFLFSVKTPKILFFPENEPNYVNIFIEEPMGTDIEVTNELTKEIEDKVYEIIKPYEHMVNAVITQVGQGTSDPGDPMAGGNNSPTPHKARITVEFVEYIKRNGVNSNDVMTDLRKHLGKYAGVRVTVDKNSAGPPVGKPINIEVSGDQFDKLLQISADIKRKIEKSGIDGIEELKTDLDVGKPELIFDVDRQKSRRFGVSTATIASELRTSLFGKELSKFKQGEDEYPIQLRLADEYRYNQSALYNQLITFRNQTNGKIYQIPISAIATPHNTSTYGNINRKDLNRIITVYSNVLDGYNANEINDQLRVLLSDYKLPNGYSIKFGGEQEKQAEEMSFLTGALGIAVFLILLIIVAQFNSIGTPIIIMTSVLLSTIGVFLGLVIFQMPFVIIMTMIGIISLAGIVVNNAIVLLDYSELLIDRKKAELENEGDFNLTHLIECLIMAGKTRLRPVLLTAITTVLGLVPLAIGLNIDFIGLFTKYDPNIYVGGENVIFWGPMCFTIIFGITFATFLTLIVVPVMFLGLKRLKLKAAKI